MQLLLWRKLTSCAKVRRRSVGSRFEECQQLLQMLENSSAQAETELRKQKLIGLRHRIIIVIIITLYSKKKYIKRCLNSKFRFEHKAV